MKLGKYVPADHPFRRVLRGHDIRQGAVAGYLNISESRLSRFLRGHGKLPKKIEERLEKLIEDIENGTVTM